MEKAGREAGLEPAQVRCLRIAERTPRLLPPLYPLSYPRPDGEYSR
jgi:hypothetical protein